ncbi:MAG: hypothetical protein ABIQ04_03455 [Candidatus Saccharimonadales bacterium]
MITINTRIFKQYIFIAILVIAASVLTVGASTTPTQALSLKDVINIILPTTPTTDQNQKDKTVMSNSTIAKPTVTVPVVPIPPIVTPQQSTTNPVQVAPVSPPAPVAPVAKESPVPLVSAIPEASNANSEMQAVAPVVDTSAAATQLASYQAGHSIMPAFYSSSKISQSERDRLYAVGAAGAIVGTLLYVFSYRYSRQWMYANVVGSNPSLALNKQ